jgi:CDGSH-type Zn-finger protein/uncharacterized Fe-S cluster protein YjdI
VQSAGWLDVAMARDPVHRTYENDSIRVFWESSRCIHTARCLQALPSVFDVRARPWVDVEAADADAVAAAVETCPTGALRYERLDDGPQEEPNRPTIAVPIPDGPLLVAGDLKVVDHEGETIAEEQRLTLCRCGRTKNQPFCDNSHLIAGFRSSEFESREPRGYEPSEATDEKQTVITATRDGSLHFEGHVTVLSPDAETLADADDLWLCRCGRSQSKPFCDASHKGEFESRLITVEPERRQAETPAAFEPNPQVPAPPAS